jgi:hypothetical protein
LNRVLLRFCAETGVLTLMEGPGDGMTGIAGINSLSLGLQGVHVTLVLPDPSRARFAQAVWERHAPNAHLTITEHWNGDRFPFEDQEFDLAWNFNVMTRQVGPQVLLSELCRVSRKYVLICVPNRLNYAFWLHRLHHRVAKQPWDHGRIDLMQPEPWQQMFVELGFRVREIIWLDCPWWPDIVDVGQLIADFFPFLKGLARRARPENRYCWPADQLPYFHPDIYPEVHHRMASLALFENSRWGWLKRRFAHHLGVLAARD